MWANPKAEATDICKLDHCPQIWQMQLSDIPECSDKKRTMAKPPTQTTLDLMLFNNEDFFQDETGLGVLAYPGE